MMMVSSSSSSLVERRRNNNEPPPPVNESSLSENNKEILRVYRRRVEDLESIGKRKPDMIVNSHMRVQHKGRLPCYNKKHGELDGIPIGLKLNTRGELSILGIHTRILQGIDSNVHESCYAVCMSGGYKDDDIQSLLFGSNNTITYTGSGGRDGKTGKQIKDQYMNCDNKSLISSFHTGKPIRFVVGLFSGGKGRQQQQQTQYRYLGLVQCIGYGMEPSVDGPEVFKFVLQPIVGKFQRPGTTTGGNNSSSSSSSSSRRSSAANNVMMMAHHHNPSTTSRRRNSNSNVTSSGEVRNRLDDKIKKHNEQYEQGKMESHTSNPVSVRGRESRDEVVVQNSDSNNKGGGGGGIISSGQMQQPKKQLQPVMKQQQQPKKKVVNSSSASSSSSNTKKRQGMVESMDIPRKKMRKEEEEKTNYSSTTARGGTSSSSSNSAAKSSSNSNNGKKGSLPVSARKRSPPKPVKKKSSFSLGKLTSVRIWCAETERADFSRAAEKSASIVQKQVKMESEKIMQNSNSVKQTSSSTKQVNVKQEHTVAAAIKTELND